jgi:hypothetical protein
MLKAFMEVAVPLEKLDSQFKAILRAKLSEFMVVDELNDDDNDLPCDDTYQLSVGTLPSGRKVYCARKANPARNRKHHIRSLLIR